MTRLVSLTAWLPWAEADSREAYRVTACKREPAGSALCPRAVREFDGLLVGASLQVAENQAVSISRREAGDLRVDQSIELFALEGGGIIGKSGGSRPGDSGQPFFVSAMSNSIGPRVE